MISKARKMEGRKISAGFDYDGVPGLLAESRQKLKKVMPATLGQAARIPGVTPSDVGILGVYVERHNRSTAVV